MSSRKVINFTDLTQLVDSIEGTDGSALRELVEVDPREPIVRLRLKPDVVIEAAPRNFDIDLMLSEALRAFTYMDVRSVDSESNQYDNFSNTVLVKRDKLPQIKSINKVRVLAEGDSWFRYPEFLLSPKATVTQLKRIPDFEINDLSHWGDTLSSMFVKKQYLDEILTFDPHVFMLSGGGNDLQESIHESIYSYSSSRPLASYLTPKGEKLLLDIKQKYQKIMSEALRAKPTLRVLIYGYDYARPTEDSQYIGQHLTKKFIPEEHK